MDSHVLEVPSLVNTRIDALQLLILQVPARALDSGPEGQGGSGRARGQDASHVDREGVLAPVDTVWRTRGYKGAAYVYKARIRRYCDLRGQICNTICVRVFHCKGPILDNQIVRELDLDLRATQDRERGTYEKL